MHDRSIQKKALKIERGGLTHRSRYNRLSSMLSSRYMLIAPFAGDLPVNGTLSRGLSPPLADFRAAFGTAPGWKHGIRFETTADNPESITGADTCHSR